VTSLILVLFFLPSITVVSSYFFSLSSFLHQFFFLFCLSLVMLIRSLPVANQIQHISLFTPFEYNKQLFSSFWQDISYMRSIRYAINILSRWTKVSDVINLHANAVLPVLINLLFDFSFFFPSFLFFVSVNYETIFVCINILNTESCPNFFSSYTFSTFFSF